MTAVDHDKDRGWYNKYIVEREDGGSRSGQKHEHCQYFVLDLTHDTFSVPALVAYANACEDEYPLLAADIRSMLARIPFVTGATSEE